MLVVAHKVVSKAEGRLRRLDEVEPGEEAVRVAGEQDKDARLVQVVLDEAAEVLRAERGVMVCVTRHGFVCANAGVDSSNAPAGEVVLLPLDADESARGLRARIRELRGVARARRRHARGPRRAPRRARRRPRARPADLGRAPPDRQRALALPGRAAGRGPGLSLRIAALPDLPEVRPGDDLGALLADAAPPELSGDDVLVVAHKVVSKAEGRLRHLAEVKPGEEAVRVAGEQDKDARLVQVVLDESAEVLRAERGVMVCVTRHGFVCANAGVDSSNAPEGEVVLLPLDPDESARGLRARIRELRGVAPAVIVTDSFGRAWRTGQTDVAIGAAGIVPLDDWRGRSDSGGRELKATAIAVADSIAGAADLARAKDSRRPAVLVSGLGHLVTEGDGPGAAALRRERDQDLFR